MEAISEAREMLTEESRHILERRPWIVSITSTGDDATGRYFPRAVQLARFVGGKPNRTFVEKPGVCERNLGSYEDMVVTTAGHSEGMVSHEVVVRPDAKLDPDPCEDAKARPRPGQRGPDGIGSGVRNKVGSRFGKKGRLGFESGEGGAGQEVLDRRGGPRDFTRSQRRIQRAHRLG